MENIQKLLSLYQSGRFQCDYWFYQNLIVLVKNLEMYDFIPQLQKNFNHVKKITELIQQNSNSLADQFDEDQATLKSQQIKKEIGLINSKEIQEIMTHCEKMKYTSYSHQIANLIKKYNFDSKYIQISSRIFNLHDPVLKIDNLLVCCLFMLKNKEKVHQILKIYNNALEKGLQLLKEFKQNLKFIKENEILKQNKKVIVYFCGIFAIYQFLVNISELSKILEGKNTFTLKISAFKKDIQQIITQFDLPQNHIKYKLTDNLIQIKSIKDLFIGKKQALDVINRSCRICLRKCSENTENHRACQQILKTLSSSSLKN